MKKWLHYTPLAALLALGGVFFVNAQQPANSKKETSTDQTKPLYRSLTTNVIKGSGNKVMTHNTGKGKTYVSTLNAGPGNQVIVNHEGGEVVQIDPNSPAGKAMEKEIAEKMINLQKQLQGMGLNTNPVPNPKDARKFTPVPLTDGKPLSVPPMTMPFVPNSVPVALANPLVWGGFLGSKLVTNLPKFGIPGVDQAMQGVENDLKVLGLQLKQLETQLPGMAVTPTGLPQNLPTTNFPGTLPQTNVQVPMPNLNNLNNLPTGPNVIYETQPNVNGPFANPYYSQNNIQGGSNQIFNNNK